MKFNGITIKGVRETVSAVRRESEDKWYIVLDTETQSVREIGLSGNLTLAANLPDVVLASGNASNGLGRETITMAELHEAIEDMLTTIEVGNADYDDGVRHFGKGRRETREAFLREEIERERRYNADLRKNYH